MNLEIDQNILTRVLSNKFGVKIIYANFMTKQLHGGTVGNVCLVYGTAETEAKDKIPYQVVLKIQEKWERYGDPDSWRREYDFYTSDFTKLFSESFRWPHCYHAQMNGEVIQLWIEYIEGVSGLDLTGEMYQAAAYELGRFQGKLFAEKPFALTNLKNLSKPEYLKNFYLHYRSWNVVYDFIRSETCEIPKHLCKMLIDIDENADDVFKRIEKLPVVLCHRDFWVTNIFLSDGKIRLIDWDTSGWGYLGEDIASLIADEADVDNMVDYFQKCVPAYHKGFCESADISNINDNCVYELILVMFGYRLVEWIINAGSPDEKSLHLRTLENIYKIGKI